MAVWTSSARGARLLGGSALRHRRMAMLSKAADEHSDLLKVHFGGERGDCEQMIKTSKAPSSCFLQSSSKRVALAQTRLEET